jgi:hypothetical protein
MEKMMSVFVDRDREMQLIDDSFRTLLDKNRLLRNPILEFYGVSGIGKTLLLEQIKERCHDTMLPYIWVSLAGKESTFLQREVVDQVNNYLRKSGLQLEQTAVSAIKVLLKQGPVVMLLDAVDETGNDQVEEIEALLRDLIDDEKLFVVLASKKMIEFANERSVARKLQWHNLRALDRTSCEEYLDKWEQDINEPEKQIAADLRSIIFRWTQGYPLAMNVMVEAINDGNDPRTEAGKQQIVTNFKERIIDQEILKGTEGDWKKRCFTLLRLLSVPRRSNTMIMEELIVHFAPEYHRKSSLAYFSLPTELHETTPVFSWNLERFGFAVETPVRHLFLLLYQQMSPQEYFAVHNFLADLNRQLAQEATGQDRVRYAREYLYHLASNPSIEHHEQKVMEALASILKEQPEFLQPFFEEFAQDQELKEELSQYLPQVEQAIQERAAQIKGDV